MNRRKHPLRAACLTGLSLLVLTVSALADSGPKPQLTVRVEHAPAEPYYLDLLEEGALPDSGHFPNLRSEARAALDGDLLQALEDAVPDGWHACLTQGTAIPMWGSPAGRDNVFFFGYQGLPSTYRILAVTAGGETWVSDPLTRQAFQSSVTVDWADKAVSAPPVWTAYVLELLCTLLPTLLIEGAVLLLMGYSLRASWKPFFLINLATQLGLYLFFTSRFITEGWSFWYLFAFLPAECVIVTVEILAYRRFLPQRGAKRVTIYAITANTASAVAGWFLAQPVWEWATSML